jgi:hypothetical protein
MQLLGDALAVLGCRHGLIFDPMHCACPPPIADLCAATRKSTGGVSVFPDRTPPTHLIDFQYCPPVFDRLPH